MRQQNAQYDHAIAALVAANRIKNGWDKPAEPEMSLTIQREVLVSLGDTRLTPIRRGSISIPTARWRPWFAWMWREGNGDGNSFNAI